jgi:hypothetical protein
LSQVFLNPAQRLLEAHKTSPSALIVAALASLGYCPQARQRPARMIWRAATRNMASCSNEMRCTSLTNPTSRLQPKPSCCRTYVESGASNVGNSQLPIPRPQSTIHEYVPLVFAKFKIRSLLKWADGLPPERHRQTGMLHNVAEMQ